MTNSDKPVVEEAQPERRRLRRVPVDLPGRFFVPSDLSESPCKIVGLSPGGATVEADAVVDVGTRVILYIDVFGRFEGSVARRNSHGFGVSFAGTDLKRERTAEQLAQFTNKTLADDSVLRRHDRTPTKGLTSFTRTDGSMIKCEVLDFSLSGVSVKTAERPQIGEFVLIGQLAGRVTRHHANGIGIEFVGLGAQKPTPDHLLFSTRAATKR